MKQSKLKIFATLVVFYGCLSSLVHAELIDRGKGMIYDDVLKITWLKDANYARTSGYDSDGRMSWDEANTWVSTLTYGGYKDWRLPTLSPINGLKFSYKFSDNGSTDVGYNTVGKGSELAYMFYINLQNRGWNDTAGEVSGCKPPEYCLTNTGVFTNLQHYVYWFNVEYARLADRAWVFYTFDGLQNYHGKNNEFHVWPVRTGDVK